jgi:hypothetical protein
MPLLALAANFSLAASAVVFRPLGALMLLPALAVAAAAFKLLLVDKNMFDEFLIQLAPLGFNDVNRAHQHLAGCIHHFHVVLV